MVDVVVGRIMLATSFMILMALYSVSSYARNIAVFDVRQNLPLDDQEEVFTDYYINGGTTDGLKVGMEVVVERRLSIHDSFQSAAAGELIVPVGKLKILFVQDKVAVARHIDTPDFAAHPVLASSAVMVGDTLKLSKAKSVSASFKGQKHKERRLEKQAAAERAKAEKERQIAAEQAAAALAASQEIVVMAEPDVVEAPPAEPTHAEAQLIARGPQAAVIDDKALIAELKQIRETKAEKDLILSTEILVKDAIPVVVQ